MRNLDIHSDIGIRDISSLHGAEMTKDALSETVLIVLLVIMMLAMTTAVVEYVDAVQFQ